MKLSIVTVNYNDAEGLERTIKSVVSQTFHDYEFIIIDGGLNRKSAGWDTGIYHVMLKGLYRQNLYEEPDDYLSFIRVFLHPSL